MSKSLKINSNKLTLIELNEVNFDFVERYVVDNPKKYTGFEKLFKLRKVITYSETQCHLLEPWIQWVSVHTGKEYSEHKIFRLGDAVDSKIPQIFELVEAKGFSVGVVSAMNAVNKLIPSSFFIPDPWTNTESDQSTFSKLFTQALRQSVNDNAKNTISPKTYLVLLYAFLTRTTLKSWPLYLKLFYNRKKRWNKALFLDLLIVDVFLHSTNKKAINFSTIFLNSFAHIQHHYFLNSKYYEGSLKNSNQYLDSNDDPFEEAVVVFDRIIEKIFSLIDGRKLFVTGLRQVPVDKPVNYFRLKDHANFLRIIGIKNFLVEPRMTRDFKISFENPEDKVNAIKILNSLEFDRQKVFNEIDDRGDSLFVVLTYANSLSPSDFIQYHGVQIKLSDHFVFVASKNGRHDGAGYVFTDMPPEYFAVSEASIHVKNVGREALKFFDHNMKK
jgi:hypothetical protein